ncbi:MAG: hypothetical protein K8T90_03375 [Planctomycetes bacterium]|nr:hypothetical protein [Planctomycetota bacterium]
MHVSRRHVALLALVAAPLILPGCFPKSSAPADVIADTLMLVVGARPSKSQAAKPVKLAGSTTIPTTVTIGGLTGTYDVTLSGIGSFSGTAKVHGGRSVAIVDKGTDGLKSAVLNIITSTFDETPVLTKAKATFSGRQTTGGVKKLFKGKIVFSGTIRGGLKLKGTIRTSGDLEAARVNQ